MAKDFVPRMPEIPQAIPVVPEVTPQPGDLERLPGMGSAPIPEGAFLRPPTMLPEEVDAYVFEPRRKKLEHLNTIRQKYGQPPVETAPVFPADFSGDIDFEDWLDSQRPEPTTGQVWKQGAGAFVDTVQRAAAAAPRMLGDKDALRDSQRMLGYPDEWGKDPEQQDISTWYGKAPRVVGGAAPFFITGAGLPTLVGSSVGTFLDVAEQSGAGEGSRLAAGGAGALAAIEAMALGRVMGGAVHKGLSKIAPPATVLSSVKTAAGDPVLHAARNVPRAMGEGLLGEAASVATLMGGHAAIQGSALAAQGTLTGNQGMIQAGADTLASAPVAAVEGLAFGPFGAIRGGMGARTANRQALQANRQAIAGGAEYRGNEILAKADPAMREAQRAEQEAATAEQILRDQETANLNAAIAREQKLRDEAALTRQAAEQEAANIAETQRALAETPLGRGPQRRPIEEDIARRQTENVQAWRDQAAAKELAAEQVPVTPVDRSVFQKEFDTAEAAKKTAAEAQAKSVEEAVSLARELKEVDLSTFEGQKKAAEILNRKPVAETKPVEVPKAEPIDTAKPVVEPVPPERTQPEVRLDEAEQRREREEELRAEEELRSENEDIGLAEHGEMGEGASVLALRAGRKRHEQATYRGTEKAQFILKDPNNPDSPGFVSPEFQAYVGRVHPDAEGMIDVHRVTIGKDTVETRIPTQLKRDVLLHEALPGTIPGTIPLKRSDARVGMRVSNENGNRGGVITEVMGGQGDRARVQWDKSSASIEVDIAKLRRNEKTPTQFTVGQKVASKRDNRKQFTVTKNLPGNMVEIRDANGVREVYAGNLIPAPEMPAVEPIKPRRIGEIVTKGGDKQYRVLSQRGESVRVMSERGEPQTAKAADLSPAKKAKFTEEDVNAELRNAGVNLEVSGGTVRQPGTAGTNRLFVDLLDRVFVPKTRAVLENKWKSLKANPAARAEWERENRTRLPDTAKEYADRYKNDIEDLPGLYEPSLNRVQLSSKKSIYHELVHAFLTKYANEAERKSALDLFKKTKNREPADEVEFQEWFNNSLKKPAVQKVPAFRRFSNMVANFFRKIMGRPPKSIEEAVDKFAEIRDTIHKGEWVDRPERQPMAEEAMFDVSPREREQKRRGEVYDSAALDAIMTERKDRYLSADKRGQLLEDIVHAGMKARGLKDRVSVDDVVSDAIKRDLDKMSTEELADRIRVSPTDNTLLAEALVRADELAAKGTKAADRDLVELQQAVETQGSEIARALAMRRWMMNTPSARSQAIIERALSLTPSEQRRWKAAKEKGDTATLDAIKEKAATRKEGIQKLLKEMFDIDLTEASDMRRLKDADLMFDVSTAIDAYQRTNRDFIADFKESPIQQSWSIAHEIRMGFILSGPATHARNIGSGVVRLAQHALQKPLESIEYAVRHKDPRAISDLGAFYAGMAMGSKQAFKNAWRSFQISNDVTELQTYGNRDSAYETHREATPGKIGGVLRSPRKLIVAGDSFFRTLSAEAEVAYLATRMAKQRGLTGDEAAAFVADQVTHYTSEARVQAFKRAKENYGGELLGGSPKDLKYEHLEDWDVLRDGNKTINEWLEKHSLTKAGIDVLQPFRASPASWLRIGLGLTPLKVVSVVTKHALHAKNPETFKYSEHSQVRDHAEMILGLALSAWATHWALEDAPDGLPRITGILPDKMRQPGVSDKLSRLGYGNYSMYIPGFGRQSFKGYGPLTEIFAFAGSYKKAKDKKSTAMERFTAPGRDMMEVVLERASAVNDAMRVRDDSIQGYAIQWHARTLASFLVPRLAKDVIDAYRPGVESTAVKGEGPGDVFVEALMDETRISQNLEKVSFFGDRIEKIEPANSIGAKAMRVFGLGPMGASSKGDIRTVELWMHEARYVPIPPTWKSKAGVKEGEPGYYRLNDEQYHDLLVKSGQARRQVLERITDKFRFNPDKHPEIAAALIDKIGEVSGHINDAARGVITAQTADERAKYQTLLDRLSQTGHTAFGVPAGQYKLTVKHLAALKEKASPKKKVDLRRVPIEDADDSSEEE